MFMGANIYLKYLVKICQKVRLETVKMANETASIFGLQMNIGEVFLQQQKRGLCGKASQKCLIPYKAVTI